MIQSFQQFFESDQKVYSLIDPKVQKLIGKPFRTPECKDYHNGNAIDLDVYGAWIHPEKNWFIPVGFHEHEYEAIKYAKFFPAWDEMEICSPYDPMFFQGWVRMATAKRSLRSFFLQGESKLLGKVAFQIVDLFGKQMKSLHLDKLGLSSVNFRFNEMLAQPWTYGESPRRRSLSQTFMFPHDLDAFFKSKF